MDLKEIIETWDNSFPGDRLDELKEDYPNTPSETLEAWSYLPFDQLPFDVQVYLAI